jgi:mono/diheme cytochrome c family protein
MPSFAQLNDEELQALVAHVRSLTRSGTYKKLFDVQLKRAADGEDDDPEPPMIAKQVEQFTRIGTPITVPTEIPAASEERLANGKRVFAQICANCHGLEGKGDGKQVLDPKFKNDNGTPATPRDLTQGVYKGGESFGKIYTRIHLGIPGTPMPSSAQALNQKDMTDLVLFIQSLAKKVPSGSTIASR